MVETQGHWSETLLTRFVSPEVNYASDWYTRIPPGTLCYINALAGEVWTPEHGRRWLADVEEDARDATDP